jgi:cytochrome b6-f complex iron-sulfur subunit
MEKEVISRGKFLKDLGMSSAALMAFYCMGTMTSCKNATDPTPAGTTTGTTGTTTTTSNKIDFTLDLTSADFSKLKNTGGFTYKDDIIIANANGIFIALSKVCTHEGTTVNYRSAQNDIKCPNHGSEFSVDGKSKLGPATKALTMYNTKLDGNSLRIFE